MVDARLRVLVVDDHPIFRVGLARALGDTPLTVIGEAGSVQEAVIAATRLMPDVILLDVVLPDGDGLDACRVVRERVPQATVVVLSSFDDVATMRASRAAGARGHLAKDTPVPELVAVVCRLASDPQATAFARLKAHDLTERELDVLERLALGWTYVATANHLNLAPETVKSYMREVYGKLGVRDRASAIDVARRRGYLASPPRTGVPEVDDGG